MADFSAVLRKAIEALKDNTPEARETIYGKARATIEAKLAAASPPLSPALAERQKMLLEDAIASVESEYAPAAPAHDDDLENLFAEFDALEDKGAPEGEAELPNAAESDDQLEPAPVVQADMDAPADWDDSQDDDWSSHGEAREDFYMAGEPDGLPAGHDQAAGPEWAEEGTRDMPDAPPEEAFPLPGDEPRVASRGAARLLPLLIVLVLLGAAVFGGWLYRDDLARIAGFDDFGDAVALLSGEGDSVDGGEEGAQTSTTEGGGSAETAEAVPTSQPDDAQPQKFTQRLMPDGQEVDEGPAGGRRTLGEGTSVAAATLSGAAQGEGGEQAAGAEGVAVGQRAIFYEERTSASVGSANDGSVVWSVSRESPGDNLPPEPTIRAEATVPEKGLQLKMTIRRNVDQSLPASHIIELIFLTPGDFSGGGINNVLRIAMKRNEQDTGNPLLGSPAKIADGFFLVALSDSQADIQTNSTLMQRENWIDIPIVYTSGRRALITLEKGVDGERIFREALEAWHTASNEAASE